MTRFARAKGSKASNERLPEEATSWTEMKEQLLNKQKEAAESGNRNAMNAKRLENFNNFISEQKNKDSTNTEWADFSNVHTITSNNKPSSAAKKMKDVDNNTSLDNNDMIKNSDKKGKKRKSGEANNTEVVNDVKIKKSLEEMTEEERTKYTNKLARRKLQKEKKKLFNLKQNGEDETNQPSAVKKVKDDDNNTSLSNDNKTKKTNKKVKKIKSGDNELVNDVKVQSLEEMTEEERAKHTNKLAKRKQQKEKKSLKLKQNGDAVKQKAKVMKPLEELTENERQLVLRKQARRKRQAEKRKLLKEEQQENNNEQEVVKKFDKPQINKKPPKNKAGKEGKRKKPAPVGETLHINGKSIDIVYVDGFPVKKEDGERLAELKKTMISKGLPRSEVQAGMKMARRRAEKALAREKKNVCFKCRQSGHNLSECPNLMNEETINSGICFKCGSTEHTHFECKVVKRQEFKFATCFICNEQGHISKQCPDNARGLYPKGGACKLCGDVTHLKKDCPKHIAEQEASTIGLETIGGDDIEGLDGKTKVVVHNKPNKIVKFF